MFEAIQRPVLELAEGLQGALLYLDAGAGEIASTTLGLPFLLGLGVTHVCSLETASSDDGAYHLLATGEPPTRLAIFTTQLLTDSHHDLLRAVMAHPMVTTVSVHCSVSEHAHACQAATELGVEAYREYAALLRDEVRSARAARHQGSLDLNGGGLNFSGGAGAGGGDGGGGVPPPPGLPALAVRITFLPLLACCLDPGLFVLPAASAAARRAVSAGRPAGFGPLEPNAMDAAAGEGGSGGLSLTAHALLALAAALGTSRPEPFPIGPVSATIAAELASLPSVSVGSAASATTATTTTSSTAATSSGLALVLVDRILDLAAPCAHTDHPWDLVLAAAAVRQAAAAMAAAGHQATRAGATSGGGGNGGRHLALWRPLDLRAPLPGADAIPLEAPWLHFREDGAAAGAAGRLGLSYGQLSYDSYGVEILDSTDRTAVARVEAVAGKSRRDGLAALRRALKEALRAEKLTPAVRSKAGAVQAPELRGLADPLVNTPGACSRQRAVAALGMAVAEAMTGPAASEWEAAAGLERSVLAALAGGGGGGGGATGSEAAVQVLMDALSAARQGRGLLHVGHVLEVLPAAFSAAADSEAATANVAAPAATSSYLSYGSSPAHSAAAAASGTCPFSPGQQTSLRRGLEEAILSCERPEEALGGRLPVDLVAALAARRDRQQQQQEQQEQQEERRASGGAGAEEEEEVVRRRLDAVLDGLFTGLRSASAARDKLKTFRKVTHLDVFAENHGALSPLLRQVVRRVMQRAEVPDWQMQPTGGGGGLVRGLLGGLMGASRALVGRAGGPLQPAQQLPADCGTVLVFVVGGISAAEVREIRAELDEHVGPGKPRFILGGTSLLLPQDITLQLCGAQQP